MRSGWRGFKWGNATQGILGQIVYLTAEDTVDFTTGITLPPQGVLLNAPKLGETAQVFVPELFGGPMCVCLVDGTTDIAVGDPLKSNATGRGIKAAVAGAYITTAAYIIGWAMAAFTPNTDGLIPVHWNQALGQYA